MFVLLISLLNYFPLLILCLFSPLFLPHAATVECYNPRTNEWTYVAKMNEPHYGHAGTVYGGYMYISGTYMAPNQVTNASG